MRNILLDKTLHSSIVQSVKALDRKFPDWKRHEIHENKKYRVEYLGSYGGTTEYFVSDKTTGIEYLAEWYHSNIENPRNHGWTIIIRKEGSA